MFSVNIFTFQIQCCSVNLHVLGLHIVGLNTCKINYPSNNVDIVSKFTCTPKSFFSIKKKSFKNYFFLRYFWFLISSCICVRNISVYCRQERVGIFNSFPFLFFGSHFNLIFLYVYSYIFKTTQYFHNERFGRVEDTIEERGTRGNSGT